MDELSLQQLIWPVRHERVLFNVGWIASFHSAGYVFIITHFKLKN